VSGQQDVQGLQDTGAHCTVCEGFTTLIGNCRDECGDCKKKSGTAKTVCRNCKPKCKNMCPSQGCTWTGSTCKASIDMVFGSKFNADSDSDRYRPEDAHSELCDKNLQRCGPCDDRDVCWGGLGKEQMHISVPQGSAPGIRTVSTWMNCTDGASWEINVKGLVNGFVDVIADGKTVASIDVIAGGHKQRAECAINNTKEVKPKKGNCGVVIPQKHGTHHVKVALRIKDETMKSEANLTLHARGLDSYVDQCMGRKFCLSELGAERDASFKLRQSAKTQLQCMLGKIPESLFDLQRVCGEWQECLSKRGHSVDDLTQSLSAAILKNNSDEPEEPASNATACLDPENADPEELECECLQTCEKLSGSKKGMCIRNLLCDHCGVCGHWKQGRCTEKQITKCGDANAVGQQGAMLVHSTKATSVAAIGNTLDDTLTGKCSQ